MLKNKHGKDKSDGAGREDGEVEDGEVGTTTAATAQKSKWAGDDGQDATPPDGTPPDGTVSRCCCCTYPISLHASQFDLAPLLLLLLLCC